MHHEFILLVQIKFFEIYTKNTLKSIRTKFKENQSSKTSKLFSSTNQINNPQHDEQHRAMSASLSSFKPVAININTFFKQESEKLSDEDLFRFLSDLKKSTNLIKKLKCLPGNLKLEFSPFHFDFSSALGSDHVHPIPLGLNNHFVLSPELQCLKLFNSANLLANACSTNQVYHQSILSHHQNLLPIKGIFNPQNKLTIHMNKGNFLRA